MTSNISSPEAVVALDGFACTWMGQVMPMEVEGLKELKHHLLRRRYRNQRNGRTPPSAANNSQLYAHCSAGTSCVGFADGGLSARNSYSAPNAPPSWTLGLSTFPTLIAGSASPAPSSIEESISGDAGSSDNCSTVAGASSAESADNLSSGEAIRLAAATADTAPGIQS
jgi:hypothetical protein